MANFMESKRFSSPSFSRRVERQRGEDGARPLSGRSNVRLSRRESEVRNPLRRCPKGRHTSWRAPCLSPLRGIARRMLSIPGTVVPGKGCVGPPGLSAPRFDPSRMQRRNPSLTHANAKSAVSRPTAIKIGTSSAFEARRNRLLKKASCPLRPCHSPTLPFLPCLSDASRWVRPPFSSGRQAMIVRLADETVLARLARLYSAGHNLKVNRSRLPSSF